MATKLQTPTKNSALLAMAYNSKKTGAELEACRAELASNPGSPELLEKQDALTLRLVEAQAFEAEMKRLQWMTPQKAKLHACLAAVDAGMKLKMQRISEKKKAEAAAEEGLGKISLESLLKAQERLQEAQDDLCAELQSGAAYTPSFKAQLGKISGKNGQLIQEICRRDPSFGEAATPVYATK